MALAAAAAVAEDLVARGCVLTVEWLCCVVFDSTFLCVYVMNGSIS